MKDNYKLRIGIIGDYDGRLSHLATEEAINHSADKLHRSVEIQWIPTKTLEEGVTENLKTFDGFWCAPGSPYQSMNGAINGIQFARENNYPFLGTCGGFQHSVLEFGRDVLQIKELQDKNFDPYLPNHYITPLSCSLVGQTRHIFIDKESEIYPFYGVTETDERYNCNFGMDKEYQALLGNNGLQIVGHDEDGEARIIMLPSNLFFVATLFQPQLSSTPEHPHPLILAFLQSMAR